MPRRVMTVDELATAAEVAPRTVRHLLAHGAIKGRKHGGVWLIEEADARRWLARYVPYGTLRKGGRG